MQRRVAGDVARAKTRARVGEHGRSLISHRSRGGLGSRATSKLLCCGPLPAPTHDGKHGSLGGRHPGVEAICETLGRQRATPRTRGRSPLLRRCLRIPPTERVRTCPTLRTRKARSMPLAGRSLAVAVSTLADPTGVELPARTVGKRVMNETSSWSSSGRSAAGSMSAGSEATSTSKPAARASTPARRIALAAASLPLSMSTTVPARRLSTAICSSLMAVPISATVLTIPAWCIARTSTTR